MPSPPRYVTLSTSMGDVTFELYVDHAPKVRSSLRVARRHPSPARSSSTCTRPGPSIRRDKLTLPCSARQTCKNFLGLATKGYYNGTVFHRIINVRPALPKRSLLRGSRGHVGSLSGHLPAVAAPLLR